jgi:hypothetical protein
MKRTLVSLCMLLALTIDSSLLNAQSIEDQYLVGDWDGDGRDNIAVRRHGNQILMDFNFDGSHDREQRYGNGTLTVVPGF